MIEALDRLGKDDNARRITDNIDQVLHVLSEAFKILVLHPHKLTRQKFPRMFSSRTVLCEDTFADHSHYGFISRFKVEV